MSGLFGGRPKNSEESDREFSKNFEVKREFLPKGDVNVQKFLWKIFDNVAYVMDEISKILGNDEKEREEMWLHIIEESLFLIGPSDPQREQILFQFFRWLYTRDVPKRKATLKRLGERLHQVVYEIDVGMEVKYNVLLILLVLGELACTWKESLNLPQPVGSSYSTEDDIERDMVPLHQYVFNNGMVNLIWMLANSSHMYTKILALSVLHKFIENLESPFPPPIEEMFESHVRRALANNKNPELQFLAYYIAKHTFGEQINIRTEDLEEERLKKEKITGKGKIYIEPHDGIMLDSNGLTIRNNTNKLQLAQVHSNVSTSLAQGKWYWEVTVCSTRYIKVGYSPKGDDVLGHVLDVKSAYETFGFALNSDEKVFRVFSSSGEDSNPPLEACTSYLPCAILGPLQQVIFNFGEPLLKNHPAVRDLFQKKDKTSPLFNLISEGKYTLPPYEYTPPNTYRQQITLPMKKGKNVKTEKKATQKEPAEKEEKQNPTTPVEKGSTTSPARTTSTSSATPWIPKIKEKTVPIVPIPEDEIEEKDPDEYCCPISKSIMSDPVIASDGRTYERSSIEQWLKQSNTSPITREKMNTDLEPNVKLKEEIELFLKRPIKKPTRSQQQTPDKTPLSPTVRKSKKSPTDKSQTLRQRKTESNEGSDNTPKRGSSTARYSTKIDLQSSSNSQPNIGQTNSDIDTSLKGSSTVRHSKSSVPSERRKTAVSPEKQQSETILEEEQQQPVRQRKVEVEGDNLTEKERRKKLQEQLMDVDEDEEYAYITDD